MAYEIGSFMAELKTEHEGGGHKEALHPQCPVCELINVELSEDCLERRKHDGNPHPLCWVCGLETDNEEIRAEEKEALGTGKTTKEWVQDRRARRRAADRKGE